MIGYDLVETRAAGQVFAKQGDVRSRRSVCYSGRQWSRNSQGIYIAKASEFRGTDREARIISAAGNFQEVRAGGFAVWDDGFNQRLAGMQVKVQARQAGTFNDLTLPYFDFTEVTDASKPDEWGGYQWVYEGAAGRLVCRYEHILGTGKWTYRFTARNGALTRYRLVLTLALVATPTLVQDTFIQVPTGNQSFNTIQLGRFYRFGSEALYYGWDDMYYAGQLGNAVVDAQGVRVTSIPFDLTDGQNVTIDPSFTQAAGWSGYIKDSYPTPGQDNTFILSGHAGGSVNHGSAYSDYTANKAYRSAMRFDISSAAGALSIDNVQWEPYVTNQQPGYTPGSHTGKYNGTGQGDPSADTTTACARMNLVGNASWRYVATHNQYQTAGRRSFGLGAQACTDVFNALAGGYFTVVNTHATESGNDGTVMALSSHSNSTPANRPQMVFDWTAGSGAVPSDRGAMRVYRQLLAQAG